PVHGGFGRKVVRIGEDDRFACEVLFEAPREERVAPFKTSRRCTHTLPRPLMGYVVKPVFRIYLADRASINPIASTIRSSHRSISLSTSSTDTRTNAADRLLSNSSKFIAAYA